MRTTTPFTADEIWLLDLFRRLDATTQAAVLAVLEACAALRPPSSWTDTIADARRVTRPH